MAPPDVQPTAAPAPAPAPAAVAPVAAMPITGFKTPKNTLLTIIKAGIAKVWSQLGWLMVGLID
jgi:hypothetical protein